MKIIQSLFVNQAALNTTELKSANQEQQLQSQPKKDTYTPSQKEPLWRYSVKEVKTSISLNITSLGTFKQPNWNIIPTKGMQTPSQDELVAQIQALAKNKPDSVTGSEQEWQHFWQTKNFLRVQYLSAVSPDRKALHAEAMDVVKKLEEQQPKHTRPLTLVDYLTIQDLKLSIDAAQNQNATVTPVHKTGGGYEYMIGTGEDTLMSSHNGQWYYSKTPLEQIQQDEFNQIFDTAEQSQNF